MNSRNIIGRYPSMVIPLLANQDLTPMLSQICIWHSLHGIRSKGKSCPQHICSGQANPRIEEVAKTEKSLSLLRSKIRISAIHISLL